MRRRSFEETVEETGGYDEIVLLRDIRFESHCEHHLAPIIGVAHVAYLPKTRVVGISKLARVVEVYARRLDRKSVVEGKRVSVSVDFVRSRIIKNKRH